MDYEKGLISIPVLIADAKRALFANAQFSALCITFALVDECSSVESRKNGEFESNEKAYSSWYDSWFSSNKCDVDFYKNSRKLSYCKGSVPRLNGVLLYKMRCSILHAMSSDIDFKKIGDDANRHIEEFDFKLSTPNEYSCEISISSSSKDKYNTLSIDVCGLVNHLLYLVELYYNQNINEQFSFISVCDFTKDYIH